MPVSAEQIVLDSEVHVCGWSMPTADGRRAPEARFAFADADDLTVLRGHVRSLGSADGRFRLVLIALDEDNEALDFQPKDVGIGPYAARAERLRCSGFLQRDDVLAALGTDAQYNDWVSRQRSVVSGGYNEVDEKGDGRCVACHVRRASMAGTGFKPLHGCVPMTNDEHMMQHNEGEIGAYMLWAHAHGMGYPVTPAETAKAWFDAQLAATRRRWAELQLCEVLHAPVLSHVCPDELQRWARKHELAAALRRALAGGDDGTDARRDTARAQDHGAGADDGGLADAGRTIRDGAAAAETARAGNSTGDCG